MYKDQDWDSVFFVVYTKMLIREGRLGRHRMVVGFTTTCAISAYHH